MDFHGCKRKRPAEELSRISFIGVCMAFKSETPSQIVTLCIVCKDCLHSDSILSVWLNAMTGNWQVFVVRYRIYPVSWGRCVSTGFSFLWHYVANWHLEATVRTNAGMVSLKPGRGKKAGNVRINVDFKKTSLNLNSYVFTYLYIILRLLLNLPAFILSINVGPLFSFEMFLSMHFGRAALYDSHIKIIP